MSRKNSKKRRLLLLASLLLCGAGVVQASATGGIIDSGARAAAPGTLPMAAIPATWPVAVAESVSLTFLGLTLLGTSALLKRLLAPAEAAGQLAAPWMAEPSALHVRRTRPVRLRPLINGRISH